MKVEMNLTQKYFKLLNCGLKDIEVRLLDEKRSQIKVGDIIFFKNSNHVISTKVSSLVVYNSFNDLINNISLVRIGLPQSKEQALNELNLIYPKEKLKNHKILAIEIKKINTF